MISEPAVADAGEVEEFPCVNHPSVMTVVACGKCGSHICPKCMIFTPVGVRCRTCAQVRKAPQFDVSADRLTLAALAGLVTSVVAWLIALEAFFFIWLLSILVGLAVGEVASRVAKRRVNRALEIAVGLDIVLGFLAVGTFHAVAPGFGYRAGQTGLAFVTYSLNDPFSLILLGLAIFAGVTRLRR